MDDRLLLLAFGFVSPWLLAGGLALSAVPLVIHLLRRRQYVDRPWAAMQFLQAALRSQARRVQLESLVLLAVRTLLIGLAATAVSRPFLDEDAVASLASAGRLRVLVIDTSLSMSAGAEGATALFRAQELAARIVESAPAADAFALVQVRRTPPLTVVQHASRDRPAILGQIRALSATLQRGDVVGALRAVQTCLREQQRTTRAEVVLISDFQASNWAATDAPEQRDVAALLAQLADAAELTCLPVAADAGDQLAITSITPVVGVSPGAPVAAVEVALHNSNGEPAVDMPVEAYVGERQAGRGTLTVPPGETAAIQIALSGLSPADRSVMALIPDDGLADDNRRWTVLPERKPLEVLLVSGRPQTSDRRGAASFVQLALSPATGGGAAIATTVIGDDGLRSADLARFACIYLCNVPQLDEADAARLRAYVSAGGGLVIALGDQAQPAGYRALQQPAESALLPGTLVDVVGAGAAEATRLTPGDYQHPVIRPFAGNPDAGLLTTEIDRYWRFQAFDEAAAVIVLSYSTGDPAIIERRLEAGRVFIVTTSLDDSWSNWALWPSFVPIVHELTRAAAVGTTRAPERLVGDALVQRLPPEEFGVIVQHQLPAGEVTDVPTEVGADGTSTATVVAQSAGIHVLHLGPPRDSAEQFAVNVDPAESRLSFLDRAAMAEVMPERPFRYLSDWQPAATVLISSRQNSLSQTLLSIVLGLLVVEQLMMRRFRIGVAALVVLFVVALAITVTGQNQIAAAGFATALLGALILTMLVRTRLRPHRTVGKPF